MKWISVKDRPAPTDRKILVWSDYCKSAHTSVYDYENHILEEYCYEDNNHAHMSGATIERVTHWMNLPQPPVE